MHFLSLYLPLENAVVTSKIGARFLSPSVLIRAGPWGRFFFDFVVPLVSLNTRNLAVEGSEKQREGEMRGNSFAF